MRLVLGAVVAVAAVAAQRDRQGDQRRRHRQPRAHVAARERARGKLERVVERREAGARDRRRRRRRRGLAVAKAGQHLGGDALDNIDDGVAVLAPADAGLRRRGGAERRGREERREQRDLSCARRWEGEG